MRPLLLAFACVLTLAGCGTVIGRLHDEPSRGSDLPFEVGAYVRDSLGGVPAINEAFVLHDDGTVLALSEASDLGVVVASDGFRAQEGTYLVVPGGVELRLLAPVPNVGGGKYVDAFLAVPLSRLSFQVTYPFRPESGFETQVHTYVLRQPTG